jgi:hypothetical protein
MPSYYFSVSAFKKGKLQWVVEFEQLSRLARFILASEQLRVKVCHDVIIKVEKSFVSLPVSENILLEEFKADCSATLKVMALEA